MDVTKANFGEALALLDQQLEHAQFVAIDEEMTGISLGNQRQQFIDTMNARYLKQRAVATTYGMIQFGISVFTFDQETNDYISYPYNFYVFPDESTFGGPDIQITLSASAIAFNRKHNMNWQKWIAEGATYANARIMEQFDKRALEELETMLSWNVPFVTSSLFNPGTLRPPKLVTPSREEDIKQVEQLMADFNVWLEKARNPDVETTGQGADMKSASDKEQQEEPLETNERRYVFPPLKSYIRQAVYSAIYKTCKHHPASNEATFKQVQDAIQKARDDVETKKAALERLRQEKQLKEEQEAQVANAESIDVTNADESALADEKSIDQRIEQAQTELQKAEDKLVSLSSSPAADPERVIERMPVHLYIETRPNPSGEWGTTLVVATLLTSEERDEVEKKYVLQRVANRDRVLGASVLLSLFDKHKVTLVGHNCSYDLLFMFAGFKELPSSLSEFASLYRRVISRTFDTKLLFTSAFYQSLPWAIRAKHTHLGNLYNACLAAQRKYTQDPQNGSDAQLAEENGDFVLPEIYTGPHAIRFAEGYTKYDESSELFHEAGYDAFCTGFVFIHIAHALACGALTVLPYFPDQNEAEGPLRAVKLPPIVDVDASNSTSKANTMSSTTQPYLRLVRPQGPLKEWMSEVPALNTLENQTFLMSSLYALRLCSEQELASPLEAIAELHRSGLKAGWIAKSLEISVENVEKKEGEKDVIAGAAAPEAEMSAPKGGNEGAASAATTNAEEDEMIIRSWAEDLYDFAMGLQEAQKKVEAIGTDAMVDKLPTASQSQVASASPTEAAFVSGDASPLKRSETGSTVRLASPSASFADNFPTSNSNTQSKSVNEILAERLATGILLVPTTGIVLVLAGIGSEVSTDDVCKFFDVPATQIKWNDGQSLFLIAKNANMQAAFEAKVAQHFSCPPDLTPDQVKEQYPLGVWKLKHFRDHIAEVAQTLAQKREEAQAQKRVKQQ